MLQWALLQGSWGFLESAGQGGVHTCLPHSSFFLMLGAAALHWVRVRLGEALALWWCGALPGGLSSFSQVLSHRARPCSIHHWLPFLLSSEGPSALLSSQRSALASTF